MHHAETLDPEVAAEAKTDLGLLWVEKHGQVLTTSLMENGYWDPTISGLIKRALTKGSALVNVGANMGYFSVLPRDSWDRRVAYSRWNQTPST